MFIQAIRGKVSDPKAMRERHEAWVRDVAPGATGWLGVTAGVADDGTFLAVVRFESEEAARANSNRPEQGAWWEETSKLFDGPVTFYDCPRVAVFSGGGSDDAGFVQSMIYKAKDVDAVFAMADQFEQMMPTRPDIIGGTSAATSDGTFIDTNYFTSEAEAREGEKKELPAEMQETMQKFGELVEGDVEYIDLREPWLFSP